jgi:uncharacterized protein
VSTHSSSGITRPEALTLLKTHLKNERLIAHCIAAEVIMRSLALHFGEDEDQWGLAGLLHDLDYELTDEDPSRHGAIAADILASKGVAPEIINAVKKHNAEGLGLTRTTVFEHALTCAETITGLIVATALVYPDKKLTSVKLKSVTKRMKTKHFARAVNRERIMECEKISIPLNEFVTLSLKAMQSIAEQLGL